MSTAFARLYLGLACVVYFFIGAGAVALWVGENNRFEVLSLFSFFASGFGLAPLRLLRFAFEPNGDGLGPGDANFLMPSLGVTAMILSVLGFAALFLYQRHPRWLWVWFFVTALSVVMAIDNSAFAAGRGEIMMGSVLHALFMLIATYALWRRAPAL